MSAAGAGAAQQVPLLRATGLRREFTTAGTTRAVLDGVDLEVRPGELVVVIGPSGAGKSTLLGLLAGLDRPTSGTVELAGTDLAGVPDRQLAEIRRTTTGFVFQSFGLVPVLSAQENVEVPLRLARTPAAERDRRVGEVLDELGLAAHRSQRPPELSGGQQQRVALARALVSRPRLLLADEPTAQLDSATAGSILELVRELVRDRGLAAVVTTHDPALVDIADRVLELRDGRLHERG